MKRALKAIFRPVYRAFFERPLWWFLLQVKTFFFAETLERLSAIERRLAAVELAAKDDRRFDHLQTQSATQWDAIEQLLLSILSQPRAESASGAPEPVEIK